MFTRGLTATLGRPRRFRRLTGRLGIHFAGGGWDAGSELPTGPVARLDRRADLDAAIIDRWRIEITFTAGLIGEGIIVAAAAAGISVHVWQSFFCRGGGW